VQHGDKFYFSSLDDLVKAMMGYGTNGFVPVTTVFNGTSEVRGFWARTECKMHKPRHIMFLSYLESEKW